MKENTGFGAFLDGWNKAENEQKSRKLFHEMWGDAVGSVGYDKKKWMELQRLLGF